MTGMRAPAHLLHWNGLWGPRRWEGSCSIFSFLTCGCQQLPAIPACCESPIEIKAWPGRGKLGTASSTGMFPHSLRRHSHCCHLELRDSDEAGHPISFCYTQQSQLAKCVSRPQTFPGARDSQDSTHREQNCLHHGCWVCGSCLRILELSAIHLGQYFKA